MRSRRYSHRKSSTRKMSLFAAQIIVCILITAGVFAATRLGTKASDILANSIKNTLYYNVDIKKASSGILKLIKDFNNEVRKDDNKSQSTDEVPTAAPDNI